MIPTEADHATRQAYYQTEQWKQLRLLRKHYDGNRCVVCGKWFEDDGAFECHHLTYKRLGHESYDDLATLCRDCHQKAHDLECARKHESSKDVIKEGLNYIISKRIEVRGIQGLLELRDKSCRAHYQGLFPRGDHWSCMFDAIKILFGKAFDYDSEYAFQQQFKDVDLLCMCAVSKMIIDKSQKAGFTNQKSMAEFLQLSPKAVGKLQNHANLFPQKLEAFNNGQ